ncbi:hypothetical protein E4T56_gene8740 [Termitomyces sp. T112]|nr:hypothetical protein E4T56_gene8740 [Termitomyces sp. T112]
MRVHDIENTLKRSIIDILYEVDTETFIEKMISERSTIVQSFQKLVNGKYYENSRWAKFPEELPGGDERALCKPFADILNAIVETISGEVGPRIVYLDCNGNKQGYLKSELGRPDGVGATRNLAMVELKDKIHKLEEEIAANSYVADENQDAWSEQKQKERELLLSYRLWWMHIHLPYEIKPTQSQWYESVNSL